MSSDAHAAPRVDILRALRDAGLAGLLALGLFLPLVGLKTVTNIRNELTLETRPGLLLILIGIVAGGRFLASLLWPIIERRRKPAPAAATRHAAFPPWFAPFALGFVVLFPPIALSLAGFPV